MVSAFAAWSPAPPRAPRAPATQSPAARILAVPNEILIQIFRHCGLAELVSIRATCKHLSSVVKNAAFDRALFRPSADPVLPEEADEIAQGGTLPQAVRLHPVLSHLVWHAARGYEDITLVKESRKQLLSRTDLHGDVATNPPLRRLYIRLQNPRAWAYFKMASVGDPEGQSGVTVKELLMAVCTLVIEWRSHLTDVEERHNLDRVVYPFSPACWFQWQTKEAPTLFIPFGANIPSWEKVQERKASKSDRVPCGGLGSAYESDDGGDSD